MLGLTGTGPCVSGCRDPGTRRRRGWSSRLDAGLGLL